MDKSEIEKLAGLIKQQKSIGLFLYAQKGKFSANEIQEKLNLPSLSIDGINALLSDLVTHGIVEPLLSEGFIFFRMTPFGTYFFNSLCNIETAPKSTNYGMERCGE